MTELREFAVCSDCCGVYLASQWCEGCGGGESDGVGDRDRVGAREGSGAAIAVELPDRRRRLKTPRLGAGLVRRRVVPGRLGWLREHAAVAVLAGLSLVLFALAGVLSG